MRHKNIFFTSLLFTALMLSPSLSHLASLPNKIHMNQEEYFIAQKVYQNWALWGIAIFGALVSTLMQSILVRRKRSVFRLSLIAFVCTIASQLVFWLVTNPANRQTDNWTVVTDNWQLLRDQWEYSHAVNSLLYVGAFIATILAVLKSRTPASFSGG